ncbi:MAG: hypothetical protein ACRDYA_02565 [Egibacteraceae bacterium]
MTSVLSSLLELIARWFGDEELQEESLKDYLESEDYGDLDAIELYEAVGLYFDTARVSAQRQEGDFSREYNTGARVNVQQHVEPPPPPKHDDDWESVDEYVSYLTTNYTYVQDNDTIVDNSVNTQIQADGDVDFDQDVDIDSTVLSGDDNVIADDSVVATGRGVAAGDDIEDSQVITGDVDGSQVAGGDIEDSQNVGGDIDDSLLANRSDLRGVVVGEDNEVVQGSDNAVGFGKGDVSQADLRDVTVDDGGALSVSGDANGYNDESREYEDSFNQDNDDVTIKESFQDNDEDNDIDVTVEDSFQDNSEDNDRETEIDIKDSEDIDV